MTEERKHAILLATVILTARKLQPLLEEDFAAGKPKLVDAIATGRGGSSLTEAIAEREKKIRQITDRLVEPGPGSLQEKLDELRTFAVSRLTDLRRLLSKPANIHEARALLAEQFGKFTLLPFEDAGKWSYTANGSVDLFGEKLARVDGAGGPDRTTRVYHFGLSLAA
jgi:hypothetical protein